MTETVFQKNEPPFLLFAILRFAILRFAILRFAILRHVFNPGGLMLGIALHCRPRAATALTLAFLQWLGRCRGSMLLQRPLRHAQTRIAVGRARVQAKVIILELFGLSLGRFFYYTLLDALHHFVQPEHALTVLTILHDVQ